MSRERNKEAVIHFLEQKKYKYLKPLGEGGFASVIAVLSPQEKVLAVKIVEKKDVCIIEDQIWPWLSHRNILPVLDVLTMDKPDVKLYLTPMQPKALDETVHNDQFRSDPNSLTKLKVWLNDILLAMEYLHSSGFCHCDLKSDNVLIDEEGRAVLCDFSGLSYTGESLTDIISPLVFRPPECSRSVASKNVQGVPYDIYTFGLMALNMLTGHWPQMEWMKTDGENFTWLSHVWPVLKKALEKQNFEYLMRISLPGSEISKRDINEAFDFILSILKLRPEERPSAKEIMKHPFLKVDGNFLTTEEENDLLSRGDNLDSNPFQEFDCMHFSGNDGNNVEQVKTAEPSFGKVELKYEVEPEIVKYNYSQSAQKAAVVESKLDEVKNMIMSEEKFPKVTGRHLLPQVQQYDHSDSADKLVCLLENVSLTEMKKKKSHYVKKNIREKVTDWFRKKFRK